MEEKVDNFLQWYFKFFHVLGHQPFTLIFTPGLKIYLKLVKDKLYFMWCIVFVSYPTYIFILIYLFITNISIYINNNDYLFLALHCMWISGPISACINQGTLFFVGEQVIQLVNANVNLINNLEAKHFHGYHPFKQSEKVRRIIVSIMAVNMLGFHLVLIPIYIMFQDGLFLLGSHAYRLILWINLFGPFYSKYIAMGTGVLVDLWNILGMQGAPTLVIYINMTFLHTFKATIRQILVREVKRFGGGQMTKLHEDLLIYSKLRVLTTMYNNVFGQMYISPITTALSITIMQAVIIAVRLTNGGENLFLVAFGITVAVVCASILVIFMVFMAMVNEYSLKLKRNILKREIVQRNALARKLVKSFKVEAVKSGNLYPVKKLTCLTLLGMLANMTGSLLISVEF